MLVGSTVVWDSKVHFPLTSVFPLQQLNPPLGANPFPIHLLVSTIHVVCVSSSETHPIKLLLLVLGVALAVLLQNKYGFPAEVGEQYPAG